jgi:UDP:flavonoid glycosyltransferase YjiC (YdhE family)
VNITVITVGSRGDVQPYVALAAGLKAAGHDVQLATHRNFEPLIRGRGLEFAPVEGNPRAAVESDLGQEWLATGSNALAFVRHMARIMRPMMAQAARDCLDASRHADLIIYSMLGWLAAHHLTEHLGVPGMAAYLQPAHPTRAFPPITDVSRIKLGGRYNRLTYLVGEQVFWLVFRTGVNEARREVLGLPPLPLRAPFPEARRRGAPALYGYSPTVLPKPSDWPDWVRVTGYWFLDRTADWRPAPELVRFLESGPPPVYVGFGSMHARSAPSLTATVVEALRRTGQRGILLSGWGALTDTGLPDGITAVDSVPHDWLFPQTAAVVHHAGAGTTGAGLRAGVPTVAIPFFADQPFWARRVFDLGAGPRPIPLKRLTAERLAGAVQIAVQDESVRARAAEVGEAIRAEDGVAQAVEAVEELRARS